MFKPKHEKPEKLPVTPQDLHIFMNDIIDLYDLPDTEDMRDNICTMILHLNANVAYVPKSYFGHAALKSLANKAAFDMLKIYKENRDKKAEEEKLAAEQAQEKKEVADECASSSCSQSG